MKTTSKASRTPVSRSTVGPHALPEAPDVGGGSALVVEDPVRVALRHDGTAEAEPLEPAGVDEGPGGAIPGRVAEDAPGAGDAERLVLPAPPPDLLEALADPGRVLRRELEGGGEDDLRRGARRPGA